MSLPADEKTPEKALSVKELSVKERSVKERSVKELSGGDPDDVYEEILSERGLFEDEYPEKDLVMRILTENCPGLILRAMEKFHKSSVRELFRVKEPFSDSVSEKNDENTAGEGVPFPADEKETVPFPAGEKDAPPFTEDEKETPFIPQDENEAVSFPRFTALDKYGDPYLPALIRSADPCEDCPEDRVCRDCRYAGVVKALYCHEEAASAREEHRAPVPPRTIPRPRSLFFDRHEKPDPVEALCEALFSPLSGNGADRNCSPERKTQKKT